MSDYFNPSAHYPHSVWRVIIHRSADGPTNMAIDEAIAEHVGARLAPPTLRIYAWEPACLSLGYAQPVADVDFDRLQERGWNIVRRLSGGRAILHVDELTYSVAVPADDPRVAGDVIESYRRLSQGLMSGLNDLGVSVQAEKVVGKAHRFKGPVCFDTPSDYEISVGGKKLLGSAQMRRSNVVLQHGTLPLHGDITRICDVLAFDSEAKRDAVRDRVLKRATTLEEILGQRVETALVANALIKGFAEALNLLLKEEQLSDAERVRADELHASKYAAHVWTNRY